MNAVETKERAALLDRKAILHRDRKYWFVRRLQDILLSLLALAVLWPLLLVVSLIIVIDSPGAGPIFSQERVGRDGKTFRFYKFRSMIPNADKQLDQLLEQNEMDGPVFKIKDDPRITKFGKFIRRTSIDELPQLFNILKGDMSFVGPRPECPHLAEEYRQIVPEFDYRLKVKAGLTGFAQVYGKYNTAPYDKLKLDLTYIHNYSFWLDLKLILLTVKVLFHKENTEGIEAWQKTAATKENLEKIGK